ncbi:hypothetical protein DFH09DRAFT_1435016 [Mycena vulgaris]|nr:hypothetical protein DFH09DRAFT_1435016 [Mycena vulgaris]
MDEPVIVDAGAPFSPSHHEINPSDLIIRSCDGVDFHAHKAILSFSSQVFQDMLAFPEPAGADANLQRDGKSVALLPESSKAVEKLLLLCYPHLTGNYHLFVDLDGIDEAYPAADKYQLTGGQKRLEEVMSDPRILATESPRVYAIACHHGLAELAKTAAVTMLKSPSSMQKLLLIPEYKFVSAYQWFRFQQFRERCIGAMHEWTWEETRSVSSDEASGPKYGAVWWHPNGHGPQCGPLKEGSFLKPATWFIEHVHRIDRQIQTSSAIDVDSVATLLCKLELSSLNAMAQCPKCITGGPIFLEFASRELAEEIRAEHAEMFADLG